MSEVDLKAFPLLEELTGEERELLAEELESAQVAAGRVVFSEGADADGLVLLAEGRLVIESRELGEVGRVGAGTALGGLSLVAPGRREVTAVAEGACRVYALGRADFRRLMDDAPRVACKLLEAVTREFAAAAREGLPGLRGTG